MNLCKAGDGSGGSGSKLELHTAKRSGREPNSIRINFRAVPKSPLVIVLRKLSNGSLAALKAQR